MVRIYTKSLTNIQHLYALAYKFKITMYVYAHIVLLFGSEEAIVRVIKEYNVYS